MPRKPIENELLMSDFASKTGHHQKPNSTFETIWKNPRYRDDFERIIALLNHYTGDDKWHHRFFSGKWNRHHIKEVVAICKATHGHSTITLWTKLNLIHLHNKDGLLSKILDFIASKLSPELIRQVGRLSAYRVPEHNFYDSGL